MSRLRAGIILLLIQLVIVLSIAGKYLYERKTQPRVWVRATQIDPNTSLRGRYLALQLLVNACNLPQDAAHKDQAYQRMLNEGIAQVWWHWPVTLQVVDSVLTPQLAKLPRAPMGVFVMRVRGDKPCDRAPLQGGIDLFLSDKAKVPIPLQPGEELWVEVTVPKEGPPRPIQLAISDARGFHPTELH